MWTIYTLQLHDNLRSLRFQVSLVVLLLFFVGNGIIYSMKIERLISEDALIEQNMERRIEDVSSVGDAAATWVQILNQETGTEFISEAGFNWFPSVLWVNPEYGTNLGYETLRTTNNWMRRFEVLDWTLIVRYVLSFLCIVLAYNAVSGELERGTLRLVMANPVPRAAFLLGKFLAHLTTLVVSVAIGSLISLAILALGSLVSLDASLWFSYMAFLLCATLFAAIFLLLSMGVSVLARNSATSLVFLVTIWTLLIVVIPQASYLVATQTMQLDDSHWDEIRELRNATWESLQREGSVPRAREIAATDGFAAERRFARRMREIDGQVNRLRDRIEEDRWEQFRVARSVNLISPGYAFQYSVEALLGSGLQWMEHFGRQGHRYREHLQKFLRARDEADPDSPHIPFLRDFMSTKELDPALIPRYQSTPVPFEQRLETGLVPITSLIVEAVLALFFALWAFHRAELSGGEQVG